MTPDVDLSEARECERFYDDRYARGYMDDWPAAKLARVREVLAGLELPGSGTAVDFGCGNGVFTAVLRDCLPGWRIVGLDISRTALEIARRVVPGCAFHHLGDGVAEPGSADLLFTHHVLEHVPDLQQTWQMMAGLAGQSSWMLHILPCGNPGSFEHELCRLRVDGIDGARGGRFFYEDEGHLRRLTTEQLARLAGQYGFRMIQDLYSFHQFEAVDWLTGNGMQFVRDLCDPGRAVDEAARRRLRRIRRQLLPMTAIKSIARRRSLWLRPGATLARMLSNRWAVAADREWRAMQRDPAGSEMCLAFQRG